MTKPLSPVEPLSDECAQRLEQLLTELLRPVWVHRAAHGYLNAVTPYSKPHMIRSAITRRNRALREIYELIQAYADETR